MQLDAAQLDPATLIGTAAVAVPAWGAAVWRAPWRRWLGSAERQHVWLGSLVLLLIVWSLRAGITPGLALQFLLVPALTLMHGWALAVVGAGVVLAGDCVQHGGWLAWPANLLCSGLVPASVISGLHRLVERYLPPNYFIYLFVTAFGGSILAFVLAALARLGVLALAGTLPAAARVGAEYLLLLPMLGLAEGFLNGLVMAVAVVYRPRWVASFDDRRYLRG